MIWKSDRDIVSSGKEIPVLRLLGCVLFQDFSRRIYPTLLVPYNNINEGHQVVRVETNSFN